MAHDVETWATMRGDASKAVKVFVRLESEPGPNELAELRSQASGLFRRTYNEWANALGEKVTERG
jgi:hypothetical protein